MSDASEEPRERKSRSQIPRDDVQLSFLCWLLNKKEELGEESWRYRSLNGADDLLRTDLLIQFTNAVRDVGLMNLREKLTADLIENEVYAYLMRDPQVKTLNAARNLRLSEAIAVLQRLGSSGTVVGGLPADSENLEPPTESARPAGKIDRWPNGQFEKIHEELKAQQAKLLPLLWGKDRWTYFGDLKANRAAKLWRRQPDSSEISDDTVFEALRKLQRAMNDFSYDVRIEREQRRVKIIPPAT